MSARSSPACEVQILTRSKLLEGCEVGMTDIKETIQGLYSLKTYLAIKAIEEHGPARESLIEMHKVIDSAVNLLSVGVEMDTDGTAKEFIKYEQDRILKIVWDVLHSGVSTDQEVDQDWVYEQIRNKVEQTY